MLRTVRLGLRRRGVVTTSYPDIEHVPYEGFLGMTEVDTSHCDLLGRCAEACPTGAITLSGGSVRVDIGLCIFCAECVRACPRTAIRMTRMYELANKDRKALEVEFFVR
jgi:formate hydrogenlyase subunit 6/NADH:ubiquinone oxidoreductase subunit I